MGVVKVSPDVKFFVCKVEGVVKVVSVNLEGCNFEGVDKVGGILDLDGPSDRDILRTFLGREGANSKRNQRMDLELTIMI